MLSLQRGGLAETKARGFTFAFSEPGVLAVSGLAKGVVRVWALMCLRKMERKLPDGDDDSHPPEGKKSISHCHKTGPSNRVGKICHKHH